MRIELVKEKRKGKDSKKANKNKVHVTSLL